MTSRPTPKRRANAEGTGASRRRSAATASTRAPSQGRVARPERVQRRSIGAGAASRTRKPRRGNRRKGESGRRRGIVTVTAWLVFMIAALSFVTWRQSHSVEVERAVRELESELGMVEAERITLSRRVEELRGRGRIMRIATEQLGMRLPEDHELVFLPARVSLASGEPEIAEASGGAAAAGAR